MAHAEHDDLGHHPSESSVCSFYVFAATNNDLDLARPPSVQMSLCDLGRVVVSQPGTPERSERGQYIAPRGAPVPAPAPCPSIEPLGPKGWRLRHGSVTNTFNKLYDLVRELKEAILSK